jgi:ABC-type glycerol-3-phosphate transport system substrate-binding protein
LPKLRDASTVSGRLVAVPQFWNTEMLFFRKDLMNDPKEQAAFKAKYGYGLAVPTTWDQLADQDEFFHRAPDLYGGWMSGVNWGIGLDYMTVLFGVGGNFSNVEKNVMLLGSPESVKALQIMKKIAKTAPESFRTQSFFDADTLMENGKLFAYNNWSYIWSTLSKDINKYGMAPLPSAGIPIGGFIFAVPTSARNPDCAKAFLAWMLGDDFQGKQMADTRNPASTVSGMKLNSITSKIPDFDSFVKVSDKFVPVKVTWGSEMYDGLAHAGSDVYSGAKTPEQAADWLSNDKFKGRKPIE